MRLFLIGFMGSGKSFTGRKLAKLLDHVYLDLDTEIEKLAGKDIPAIFEQDGEGAFREIERNALHQTAAHGQAVIACGGGTPCFFDNVEWMNRNGICIYLKTSTEVLFQRLVKEKDYRPLLRKLSEKELRSYIRQKVQEREVYYMRAGVIYEQDQPAEDVASNLLLQLPDITGH